MRTNSYVCGTFNGTGTAGLYICCGFIPEWVKVINLEDADVARIEWNIHMMRVAETARGLLLSVADVAQDALAAADLGITPYKGGDAMDGTYYLVPIEQRLGDTYRNQRIDRSDGDTLVTKWTLGSATNHTGNFDNSVDTTYVGEGSLVIIDGVPYGITALSNDGDAANEVTLSDAAPDGRVDSISPMYDYIAGESGKAAPPGFFIEKTTVINVSGEMCWFEAGTFAN